MDHHSGWVCEWIHGRLIKWVSGCMGALITLDECGWLDRWVAHHVMYHCSHFVWHSVCHIASTRYMIVDEDGGGWSRDFLEWLWMNVDDDVHVWMSFVCVGVFVAADLCEVVSDMRAVAWWLVKALCEALCEGFVVYSGHVLRFPTFLLQVLLFF